MGLDLGAFWLDDALFGALTHWATVTNTDSVLGLLVYSHSAPFVFFTIAVIFKDDLYSFTFPILHITLFISYYFY